MMGFYEKRILPKLIDSACGTKPTRRQREKVVPQAEGRVLEIGIGSGLNLPHYDAARVTHLFGLEPSPEMRQIATERVGQLRFPFEFIDLPGEEIPLEADSVDTVVTTFTLCTIPDAHTALEGMRRVLKPGGRLLFCEHGEAPDAGVLKWQNRINPVWQKIGGGCNLNRRIFTLIEEAGFTLEQADSMYLPGTPRVFGFNYWGVARIAG